MTEIHCSACDTLVQPGSKHCSGCGLQLTAQATPAAYVEGPRFGLWTVIGVAVVVLLVLLQFAKK